MEAAIHYPEPPCVEDMTEEEFAAFINAAIEEVRQGLFLDFNEVFDELEARFCAHG